MKRLEGKIAIVTSISSGIGRTTSLSNSTKTFLDGENSKQSSRSPEQSRTEKAIQTWLLSYLSKLLLVGPHELDVRLSFDYYGMGSVDKLCLISALADWLGCQLSLELVCEYPTIEKLGRHLAEESPRLVHLGSCSQAKFYDR